MKTVLSVVIAIGMLGLVSSAALAQSGNDLFQQALVKERTEGNMAEAIKLYQTIAQKYGTDRKLAAKALVQMGQCYEKLGSTEARKAYGGVEDADVHRLHVEIDSAIVVMLTVVESHGLSSCAGRAFVPASSLRWSVGVQGEG